MKGRRISGSVFTSKEEMRKKRWMGIRERDKEENRKKKGGGGERKVITIICVHGKDRVCVVNNPPLKSLFTTEASLGERDLSMHINTRHKVVCAFIS
jgi:hypothetical protein